MCQDTLVETHWCWADFKVKVVNKIEHISAEFFEGFQTQNTTLNIKKLSEPEMLKYLFANLKNRI